GCTKCKEEKELEEFYKDKQKRSGFRSSCKDCYDKFSIESHKKFPWKKTLYKIKSRCNNINDNSYSRYGGRGIKCRITAEEIKKLWFRDKAYEMEKPSIDREDNDGHYEFGNCRYMELVENIKRAHIIPVLQFDLDGNFIREFVSIMDAERNTGIDNRQICRVTKKQRKQCHGFIWKYKENTT
ncbi:unnamed protein product, partial [marine sediment metagenome]